MNFAHGNQLYCVKIYFPQRTTNIALKMSVYKTLAHSEIGFSDFLFRFCQVPGWDYIISMSKLPRIYSWESPAANWKKQQRKKFILSTIINHLFRKVHCKWCTVKTINARVHECKQHNECFHRFFFFSSVFGQEIRIFSFRNKRKKTRFLFISTKQSQYNEI